MRISSTDLCLDTSRGAGGDGVDVVVGAGAGVWAGGWVIWLTASDFNDAETERSSSEILFSVVVISSTLCSSWFSFSLSVLTGRSLFRLLNNQGAYYFFL